MTLEEFIKDFDEKIGKMSDKELRAALERAGCKFDNEDDDSQTDYKNSLKNDY